VARTAMSVDPSAIMTTRREFLRTTGAAAAMLDARSFSRREKVSPKATDEGIRPLKEGEDGGGTAAPHPAAP